MGFPGKQYAPPGVYTETTTENPVSAVLTGLKLPVFMGEGNENLVQTALEVVRGSSASVDQQVVQEDMDGRAVVSISGTGVVTLGAFDGVLDRIQVRNFPLVSGDGTGVTTNSRNAVTVTINQQPIVIRAVTGVNGVIQLAQAPALGDVVRVTYFFDRTDTLTTDTVSGQVTTDPATIYGVVGVADVDVGGTETFDFLSTNNQLVLTVDREVQTTITIPVGSYSARMVGIILDSAGVGTLTATRYEDNFGKSAVVLVADNDITIGAGSANAVLGLVAGQTTARNRTFYTYNGPIVDGSNGGVTTTDPGTVTVRVDGTAVVPTSVDGSSRAVTLPYAPASGSTVTVTYYFNTWQDTFDYLAHIGVTDVTRCGITADRSDFVEGADFVLHDDKIVWGTAALVDAGTTVSGSGSFGSNQITPTLVDVRAYLETCNTVVDTSVTPSVVSKRVFQLPYQPTTGNGRSTPLGSSLFQSVSNNRIGLPTDRPDLVLAYWGYSVQDALSRGAVTVVKVDSTNSTFTLASDVPPDANVYATFYYNTITDATYTMTCVTPGASGIGTYTVQDSAGDDVYGLTYNTGSKGSSLTGIAIQFPSGSEYTPDFRFESGSQGPVEEAITVRFAATQDKLAKYATPGYGPYYPISGASDHVGLTVDAAAYNVDLSTPSGIAATGGGFFATLVGEEVVYTGGGTAGIVGRNFELDANEEFNLKLDGVTYTASFPMKAAATRTVADMASYINRAVVGETGAAQAGGAASITLASTASDVDDYYVGWTVFVKAGPANHDVRIITAYNGGTKVATVAYNFTGIPLITNTYTLRNIKSAMGVAQANIGGLSTVTLDTSASAVNDYYVGWKIFVTTALGVYYDEKTVTDYDGATKVATVSSAYGVLPAATDLYYLYDLTPVRAKYTAAGHFTGSYTVALASGFHTLRFTYTGFPTTAANVVATIADGTYTPSALAAAVGDAINKALRAHASFALDPPPTVDVTLNGSGQLEFAFTKSPLDSSAVFEFVATAALADDFSPVAGISTDDATGKGQAKIIDGAVSTYYSDSNATEAAQDRLILRNRLVPGSALGSPLPFAAMAQTGIEVLAGSANAKAGLTTGSTGEAGWKATVLPATLVGSAVDTALTATVPQVTFYADGGTTDQNNIFKFNFEGTPIQVTFADSTGTAIAAGASAVVPLCNDGVATDWVVKQIADAIDTAFGLVAGTSLTNGYVALEGDAVRFMGSVSDTTSVVTIGAGNANSLLGFVEGTTAVRTSATAKAIASACMNQNDVTAPALTDWLNTKFTAPDASSFAKEALASTILDDAGREYLFFESQGAPGAYGSSTSVYWTASITDSVLLHGTGVNAEVGDGAVGDDGVSGYFVTSSVSDGSGSANTSVFNAVAGTSYGQDGVVGQTYRDDVTGLTFTVLPLAGGQKYPTGVNATFQFQCRKTFTTNSNIPITTIPGIELLVTNTASVGAANTALLSTYHRSGNEPGIGEYYYATYIYTKQNFSTALYTKLSIIEQAFGETSPDNPVSLAAHLAMLNGAVIVGIKQILKGENGVQGTVTAYRDAIDELEGSLPGSVYPDILCSLRGDNLELYQYLLRHCDLMSSIRYRAERTAVCGTASGTSPTTVQSWAQNIGGARFRMMYPDSATLNLTDALNVTTEYLVDGPFLAAAQIGRVASPNVDVATPWTGMNLVGFTGLGRNLDIVTMNQIAQKGVTLVESRPPNLRIRHGLTTDMTNNLTKIPTIYQITDEVQQRTRDAMEKFIGVKFLPGILSQIEGRQAQVFKFLVDAQIISAYTGIHASIDPSNPTTADLSAAFSPIFPLEMILVRYFLRSSL